jgi:hypothetical protein
VEAEAWVDHEAVMDSWERLAAAMGLLARTQDLLGDAADQPAERGAAAGHGPPGPVLDRRLGGRLDDETAARRHAAGAWPEVAAALGMLDDLGRWQDAFARPG